MASKEQRICYIKAEKGNARRSEDKSVQTRKKRDRGVSHSLNSCHRLCSQCRSGLCTRFLPVSPLKQTAELICICKFTKADDRNAAMPIIGLSVVHSLKESRRLCTQLAHALALHWLWNLAQQRGAPATKYE